MNGPWHFPDLIIVIFFFSKGTLSPIAPLLFALAADKHSYRLQRLPPGIPTSSNELWFYSNIFLYCILLAVGICMLATSVWILLKHALSEKVIRDNNSYTHYSEHHF